MLATSAEDGLRLVNEVAPDVIVSDIGMPEKDGLAMMRELRARADRVGKTPAIALTAFARSEDRTRAMLAGYQVHLAKPVEPQELLAAVASLAGRTGVETLN
jgi:CheY-like chemotaxis protein